FWEPTPLIRSLNAAVLLRPSVTSAYRTMKPAVVPHPALARPGSWHPSTFQNRPSQPVVWAPITIKPAQPEELPCPIGRVRASRPSDGHWLMFSRSVNAVVLTGMRDPPAGGIIPLMLAARKQKLSVFQIVPCSIWGSTSASGPQYMSRVGPSPQG